MFLNFKFWIVEATASRFLPLSLVVKWLSGSGSQPMSTDFKSWSRQGSMQSFDIYFNQFLPIQLTTSVSVHADCKAPSQIKLNSAYLL